MTRLRAVVLGDPGAGKSTQGGELARIYEVPHVSMGDLVRDQVGQKTAIGRRVARRVARGDLIPDALAIGLLCDHLARSGATSAYVLDGFPRTVPQADSLQGWGGACASAPNVAVWLNVPARDLKSRLRDRRLRVGRSDDNEATVSRRLSGSHRTSQPLKAFYRRLGILVEVDGAGTVEEVAQRVREAVRALVPLPPRRGSSRSDPMSAKTTTWAGSRAGDSLR
jgi:adenylate kinase